MPHVKTPREATREAVEVGLSSCMKILCPEFHEVRQTKCHLDTTVITIAIAILCSPLALLRSC
jgi:hypothetical protein